MSHYASRAATLYNVATFPKIASLLGERSSMNLDRDTKLRINGSECLALDYTAYGITFTLIVYAPSGVTVALDSPALNLIGARRRIARYSHIRVSYRAGRIYFHIPECLPAIMARQGDRYPNPWTARDPYTYTWGDVLRLASADSIRYWPVLSAPCGVSVSE